MLTGSGEKFAFRLLTLQLRDTPTGRAVRHRLPVIQYKRTVRIERRVSENDGAAGVEAKAGAEAFHRDVFALTSGSIADSVCVLGTYTGGHKSDQAGGFVVEHFDRCRASQC